MHKNRFFVDCYYILMIVIVCIKCVISQSNSSLNAFMNISQYNFVPNGSFSQFTLSSMRLQQKLYNGSNAKFTIIITIQILQPINQIPLYNILIFPSLSNQSEYIFLSYKKSLQRNLSSMMPPFPIVYSTPQTPCSECYNNAISNQNGLPTACLNCNQKKFTIQIVYDENLLNWNNTFLTIIDNSYVINSTINRNYFQYRLIYGVDVEESQEYIDLYILYFSVITALIIIVAILAIVLTVKIKNVEKQIKYYQHKQEKDQKDKYQ